MKREQRLRRAADFQASRERAGRPRAHPLVLLFAVPSSLDSTRVGVTVGRRVGKAVVRNRVKRRIREAVRLKYAHLRPGHDLVFVARPASAEASWEELSNAVYQLLTRAGLWATPARSSDR
jgi:ribonuclease P protein component